MPQVLLTGAAGTLGTHMRGWFAREGRAVLATDIRSGENGSDIEIVDLADTSALNALMTRDVTAVVHLGGMAKEAGWQTILDANIIGTYNVFDAARRAGIRRIIYASSYHVLGMHNLDTLPLGPDAPLRPDSLYGVSKIFGETLGRLYYDKFGLECMAIRICTAGNPKTARECRLWCNRDDLAALIVAGLEVPKLGFRTIFGISDNDGAWYFNPPDADLGWVPQHSSRELNVPYLDDPIDHADPQNQHQGGAFASWPHQDDLP